MVEDSAKIKDRAKKIKLIIMDVDGVLTDGRIIYDVFGDEFKFFDVKDGLGIILASRLGIKTAIISAKGSKTITRRAKELGVKLVFQNCPKKIGAYQKILRKLKLQDEEVCYIGDDLVDLGPMRKAGLSVAVENAVEQVKNRAHYITKNTGGRGAVREVIDMILTSQEKWDEVLNLYET